MLRIDRARARAAFAAYVAAYDPDDPKIRLKVDHTYRVADLAERVARDAGLTAADVELAWLCGLVHDIGRFEQVRRFGTFNDAASVPHAALGLEILFDEGRLADFALPGDGAAPDALHDPDAALVRTVVGTHGDFRLPAGLDARTRALCDVLRDADKVDILKAICESDPCDVLNVSRADILSSEVSPATRAAFAERRCVRRDERSTPADMLVGYACLVFELVSPLAVRVAAEQGFVFKLFALPYTNPRTAALVRGLEGEMRAWLDGRVRAVRP